MKQFIAGAGQLGSAIHAQMTSSEVTVARVDWNDHAKASGQLADQLNRFSAGDEPVSVAWCAGAGVVGTPEQQLARERELLRVLLATLDHRRAPTRLFLASSAGGLYAGNRNMCDERTTPTPTSDYGRSKLEQESMTTHWATRNGADVLIGRISNLYGPRQNLAKRQGFISHLLESMRTQQPFVYTVSASTIRDFVYTDDVAKRIATWLTRPQGSDPGVMYRILAAERSVSLAQVATIASRITHRQARVLFVPRRSDDQPSTIRFSSIAPRSEGLKRSTTSIEHGLWLTWQSVLRSR